LIVLGLNAFGHDAAAVLLVDGRTVFASSEERFDRRRHSASGLRRMGLIETGECVGGREHGGRGLVTRRHHRFDAAAARRRKQNVQGDSP